MNEKFQYKLCWVLYWKFRVHCVWTRTDKSPKFTSNECVNIFITQIVTAQRNTGLKPQYNTQKHLQNRYSLSSCFLGIYKWCNDSGVVNLHHGYFITITTSRRFFRHNPVPRGTKQPIRKSEFFQRMIVEFWCRNWSTINSFRAVSIYLHW